MLEWGWYIKDCLLVEPGNPAATAGNMPCRLHVEGVMQSCSPKAEVLVTGREREREEAVK